MHSKASLLVVALCALATNLLAESPTVIVAPGESCPVACGVSTDIKASFADNLLLVINLSDDIAHDFAILLSEINRGNRTDAVHKSGAAIIGLDKSDDLEEDFRVFIAWVESHPRIVMSHGLRDIVNGDVSGLNGMLAALKKPKTGNIRVNGRAAAYYFIAYLGGFRTSYAKYPNDPTDIQADADFEKALGIQEAITMYRSFKFFFAGNKDVWRFMVTGRPKARGG